jgi:hypothetical protein
LGDDIRLRKKKVNARGRKKKIKFDELILILNGG